MRRATQGLLLAFLGAVLLRLALTDAYLRYVTSWMKWPIAVSGLLLLALAAGPLLRLGARHDDEHDHEHDDEHGHGGVPRVTWLLLLPGLVSFVVSPPQLGSYLAERRSGEGVVVAEPDDLSTLDAASVIPVRVTEFIWRAQNGGGTLEGQPIRLTGFVSYDDQDHWYVTRMVIGCCAADATAYRVQVAPGNPGDPAVEGAGDVPPPRDEWVEVTGTYAPGTGTSADSDPVITASAVTQIDVPKQTYE